MSQVTRRKFLARSAAAGAVAGLYGIGGGPLHAAEPLVKGMPHAEKLGWRVGFSAYSFRSITAFETLEKIAATGLHYVELFSWQKLSPKHADTTSGPGLSEALRKDLKKKAADLGVKMIAIYGRLGNADSAKALFEFAADMQLEAIVGEPKESLLDTVEGLTQEFKVDLALHNHPKPSHYWNPDTGLAAMKGRSKRMGFCCDTGHWVRCGLDPVETLRKVAPRVKTFHLKDLEEFGVPKTGDVIWGQGKGQIAGILAEVKKLDIKKPYIGIEWERDPNEPLQTHAKSAAFLEQVAGKL